jgi:hypothetical protein
MTAAHAGHSSLSRKPSTHAESILRALINAQILGEQTHRVALSS